MNISSLLSKRVTNFYDRFNRLRLPLLFPRRRRISSRWEGDYPPRSSRTSNRTAVFCPRDTEPHRFCRSPKKEKKDPLAAIETAKTEETAAVAAVEAPKVEHAAAKVEEVAPKAVHEAAPKVEEAAPVKEAAVSTFFIYLCAENIADCFAHITACCRSTQGRRASRRRPRSGGRGYRRSRSRRLKHQILCLYVASCLLDLFVPHLLVSSLVSRYTFCPIFFFSVRKNFFLPAQLLWLCLKIYPFLSF